MYCHVTSRKSSLIYPSSRETGINPAELNSSSHSVTSPVYHLTITREISSCTLIILLPFLLLPAAVPVTLAQPRIWFESRMQLH